MPLLEINSNHFSKKYLVIHDDRISEFTGGNENTIVIPPHMVRDGLICARHRAIADKIDTDLPTYQQLRDRLEIAETSLSHTKGRLRDTDKDMIARQTALDKLQKYYDSMPFNKRFKFLIGG